MKNNISFDTYLFISPKQFTIYVSSISDFKKIYEQKMFLELDSKQINFFKLENFLNENIFKIEKVLKNFIKKIIVIIDFDVFFPIQISVKKKNHGDLINLKSLSPLLNEAKDCCKKTIGEKKIIHMIIDSYQINDKHSSDLPKNLKCNNFLF